MCVCVCVSLHIYNQCEPHNVLVKLQSEKVKHGVLKDLGWFVQRTTITMDINISSHKDREPNACAWVCVSVRLCVSSLQTPAEAHKCSAFTLKRRHLAQSTAAQARRFSPADWLHGLNSRPRRQWPPASGQDWKTLIILPSGGVHLQSRLQNPITSKNPHPVAF